jgi:hypothetical protein
LKVETDINSFTASMIGRNSDKAGADPGIKVGGGRAHLKKLRQVQGGAKIFEVFRVKNHDFTPKNHIFSNFWMCPTPGSTPVKIHKI